MQTNKMSAMQTSETNAIKNELKEFLDGCDLANLFFDGEVGEADNFNEKWLDYHAAYTDLQNMITAGFAWENVEQVGGEGEGDIYYNVYKFTKDGEECFVKFDGGYSSYVGSEYNEYFFVTPELKTVLVYA